VCLCVKGGEAGGVWYATQCRCVSGGKGGVCVCVWGKKERESKREKFLSVHIVI
jgi:hypothetical protein